MELNVFELCLDKILEYIYFEDTHTHREGYKLTHVM